MERFRDPTSSLRIVVAAIAFRMGLDCSNICKIYHWGSSPDVETYLQQIGRAGRDNRPAYANLYYGGRNRYADENMKAYSANEDICRRKCILVHFVNIEDNDDECMYTCCDICASKQLVDIHT